MRCCCGLCVYGASFSVTCSVPVSFAIGWCNLQRNFFRNPLSLRLLCFAYLPPNLPGSTRRSLMTGTVYYYMRASHLSMDCGRNGCHASWAVWHMAALRASRLRPRSRTYEYVRCFWHSQDRREGSTFSFRGGCNAESVTEVLPVVVRFEFQKLNEVVV